MVASETGIYELVRFSGLDINFMHPGKYKNLLFDFDGTLVNSTPLHEAAFRDVLSDECKELLTEFSYESIKGSTTENVFRQLGITNSKKLTRCIAAKQSRYREFLLEGKLSLLSGALELLTLSRNSDRRVFLVTSGSADSVSLALNVLNLDKMFEGILTSNDVSLGKPAPDLFLCCLHRFGLSPAMSVAIEDACSGVSAARSAGLAVIGVNNPQIAQKADWFYPDLLSLQTAIFDCRL